MTEVAEKMISTLNPTELAARLRVSERTLYNWRRLDKGPRWVKEGHTIRYPINWLNRYMEAKGRRVVT